MHAALIALHSGFPVQKVNAKFPEEVSEYFLGAGYGGVRNGGVECGGGVWVVRVGVGRRWAHGTF